MATVKFTEELALFSFKLHIYVGFSDEEMISDILTYTTLTDDDRSELKLDEEAYCYKLESGQVIVRLKKFDNTPEDIGILAHELQHAVNHFMEYAGIKFSSDSEEVFTYSLEDLLVKCLNRLIK